MSNFPRVAGGSFGEWLEGAIQVKPGKVRFVPDDAEKKPMIFDAANCPKGIKPGEYVVQIDDKATKILNYRPSSGQFVLRFVKFAGKEGEKPTPKSNTGTKGGGTYLTFTPILEIVDGEHKGLQFPYNLYYKFELFDMDGKAYTAVKGSGAGADKVIEFLELSGIDKYAPFPWSDNLLPKFEKIALKENQSFLGVAKHGKLVTLMPISRHSKSQQSSEDDFDTPDEED